MSMGLLGIFVAKIISLSGIGALIAGMFVRPWIAALAIGAALGIAETALLTFVRITPVLIETWIMGIIACCMMAAVGWLIKGRRR